MLTHPSLRKQCSWGSKNPVMTLKVMKFRKTLEGTDSDRAHSGTHISSDNTGIRLPFQTETGRWETEGGLWRQAALPSNPSSPRGRTELLGIGGALAPLRKGLARLHLASLSHPHLGDTSFLLSCHAKTLAWFFSLRALSMVSPNAANLQTCLQ